MNGVIRHLRRAALPGADGVTDGRLLEEFRARHDEAAFEALLRRHGPMVLGVCRRVLRQQQDAEDAFQATFLVLARKAASIRTQAVGNWLYGVAYRTAMKARLMTAKRRVKERQAGQLPRPETAEDWQELLPVLDRELSRLPDKYRAPMVLCELEGKSRKEAAGQLGLPEGTLSSRLARGRAILARRLGGRAPAAAVGVLALAREASARVPAGLMGSTVGAATGTAPVRITALTAVVLKGMLLTKLRIITAVALAVVVTGLGIGACRTPASQGEVAQVGPASLPAGGKKQTAEKKDLKWLEGTWEVISSVVEGNEEMPPDGRKVWLTFRGDAFTIQRGDTITFKGTVKVDPTSKPKALDLNATEGSGQGKTILAIYDKRKGGDLLLCEAFLGDARPTEFTSDEGSRRVLQTLRRVKPADAQDEAVRKELKLLEGTWEMVSVVGNGKKGDFGKPIRITIRGNAFTAERLGTSSGKSLVGKGPLKVYPSKTPKTIDFLTTEGPGKGTKALMIYELKGDELRLCEKTPDGKKTVLPRPTEFAAGPGSGQSITTLRRMDP